MTAKNKVSTRVAVTKLKLKKETLRDLDVKKGGKAIKGGQIMSKTSGVRC